MGDHHAGQYGYDYDNDQDFDQRKSTIAPLANHIALYLSRSSRRGIWNKFTPALDWILEKLDF